MNHSNLRQLYSFSGLPVFQNYMHDTKTSAQECPRGNMLLVENQQTGLIYNADFQPGLLVYDQHYQNEQALSPFFHKHLQDVVQIVEQTMSGKKLIEVGCGKGFFLEMLEQQNFDITGFDPTYEGKNPKISRTYFQSDTGLTADGLVLRHVLEHIPDPYAFLAQLREANGGKGLIYIEVPCFDWICTHKAWFDIFYEHVNYFRLIDMQRMFGTIIRSGHLFGGQYMYVVADLDTLTPPLFQIENQANFPEDFTGSLEYLRKIKSDSFIIWGGASKGVIFALLSERIGIPIEKVIDINPAKQEKYLPATGLRIEAPAQALHNAPENTTIFIMNSNYSDEIKNMSNNKFNYVEVDSV